MTCDHGNPKALTWPGGHAQLTARGAWVAYYDDKPGEVFTITSCPECLATLHTRRPGDKPDPDIPSAAFSARYRREHGIT